MKISVIGKQYPDSFARSIAETFKDMGHVVDTIDENPLFFSAAFHFYFNRISGLLIRTRQVQNLIDRSVFRRVVAFQPDLVVNTYRDLQPQTVQRLKSETDARIVFWYPDAITNLDREYILAGEYDVLFLGKPYIVDFVTKKLNQKAHFLPEACNPRWHKRVCLTPEERNIYECDLTIAGNMYYYRAMLLEQFVDYDFKIWGPPFPSWLISPLRKAHQNVHVAELEKSKAYGGAKIVINTQHYAEIWGANCRTFEAAGCGGFQITDNLPVISQLFEPGREIVLFETAQELKEKVDYYLAHSEERQAIADAGYARAHREHTYKVRLRQMLAVVFPDQYVDETEEACKV